MTNGVHQRTTLNVELADREGFEPPVQLPVRRISSAVLSTTQPPVRAGRHPLLAMRGERKIVSPGPPRLLTVFGEVHCHLVSDRLPSGSMAVAEALGPRANSLKV